MHTKSFLVDLSNWDEVKECLIRDGAVIAMGALHFTLRVILRFTTKQEDKDFMAKFGFRKIKTKTHHIRVFHDDQHTEPLVIVKPRGFLKMWQAMERMDMPEFVAEEVFDPDCSREKRKHLLGKAISLKAFW